MRSTWVYFVSKEEWKRVRDQSHWCVCIANRRAYDMRSEDMVIIVQRQSTQVLGIGTVVEIRGAQTNETNGVEIVLRPNLVSETAEGVELPVVGRYARVCEGALWNPCVVSEREAEQILAQARVALTETLRIESFLTSEDVRWAYRVLLDRLPENEAVVMEKLAACKTMPALRRDILHSEEFLEKNSELRALATATLVLKELPTGSYLWLDLSDQAIGVRILHGIYECDETAFVLRTVKPGMTVIDLGANIGYFTLLMADLVGPDGRVYAFEPLPRNVALLRRSVRENKLQRRVIVIAAAVAGREGRAQVVVPRHSTNWGGAYLAEKGAPRLSHHDLVQVRALTLDSVDIRRRVDFIKADIEGAEYLALQGAAQLLRRDRPVVMCECNPVQLQRVSGVTPQELVAVMHDFGYSSWQLRGGGVEMLESRELSESLTTLIFQPR
ncbi:MAG: FkbM family methyltransferase [bacterium]|nr:FkbM family methyltransferase [bacterium]